MCVMACLARAEKPNGIASSGTLHRVLDFPAMDALNATNNALGFDIGNDHGQG